MWLRRAAAICERPALWTQTNSTLGLSVIGGTAQSTRRIDEICCNAEGITQ